MLKDVPGIFTNDLVYVWTSNRKLKGQSIWQGAPRLWEVSIEP